MIQDVAHPIYTTTKRVEREEVFIVYFDGFIKNVSEGVVRTMLRDEEDWIGRYPYLETYEDLEQDELYEQTMLMRPEQLLYALSGETLTMEVITKDLDKIIPDILYNNSKITTFEFALYQMLQESYVKKCYIFKDEHFYKNEVDYIERQYKDVIDKIEMISGGFLTLFEEVEPTTIYLTNVNLVLDYIPNNYSDEELDNKMFIVANSVENLDYDEKENLFLYKEEFSNKIEKINSNAIFGVSVMFNFAVDTFELDIQSNNQEFPETTENEV